MRNNIIFPLKQITSVLLSIYISMKLLLRLKCWDITHGENIIEVWQFNYLQI